MGSVTINLQNNSEINFKSVEIDDLTDENCLFLDEQDEDVYNDVVDAVKARTIEVINENLASQGVEPVIEENNNNNNNITPEQPTDEQTDDDNSSDEVNIRGTKRRCKRKTNK